MTKEQFEQAQTLNYEMHLLEGLKNAAAHGDFAFSSSDGDIILSQHLKMELSDRIAETISALYYEKQSYFDGL